MDRSSIPPSLLITLWNVKIFTSSLSFTFSTSHAFTDFIDPMENPLYIATEEENVEADLRRCPVVVNNANQLLPLFVPFCIPPSRATCVAPFVCLTLRSAKIDVTMPENMCFVTERVQQFQVEGLLAKHEDDRLALEVTQCSLPCLTPPPFLPPLTLCNICLLVPPLSPLLCLHFCSVGTTN